MSKSILQVLLSASILLAGVLLSTCKHPTQPPSKFPCEEDAKLALSRFTIVTVPPPPGFGTDSINCPYFDYRDRPFHIGDTLAVMVSQNWGAQIIGDKPVTVTIRTMFGDTESYLLKNGFWPCESQAVDVEIYRAIISYNSLPLGGPPYPFPNNGELEIRTTGDTLIASYLSLCSGDTLRDSVAIVPK